MNAGTTTHFHFGRPDPFGKRGIDWWALYEIKADAAQALRDCIIQGRAYSPIGE